jgi:hypothetical protein
VIDTSLGFSFEVFFRGLAASLEPPRLELWPWILLK